MSRDSNRPQSRAAPAHVFRRDPWPIRVISAAFVVVGVLTIVADRHHPPGILIALTVTALVLLLSSERSGVRVSSEGVRNVPLIGRARTYPWSEIHGFAVGKVPGGYGGPVVSMRLTDRTVFLTATEYRFGGKRRVTELCDGLNTELRRAGKGRH